MEKDPDTKDSSDLDGGLFALMLPWPILHGLTTDSGVFGSLGVGVGGCVLMFILMAIVAGMVEGWVGQRRAVSTATGITVAMAAIYWFRNYPWWAGLSLVAVGLLATYGVFRRETRRGPRSESLPARAEDVLFMFPELPEDLQAVVDAAREAFLTIRRYILGELAEEDLVQPDQVLDAAENSLVGILEQARRQLDLEQSEALAEAAAEGRARLEAKLSSLQATRDQLLIFAQARAGGHGDALSDRATTLRHSVTALREMQAEELQ